MLKKKWKSALLFTWRTNSKNVNKDEQHKTIDIYLGSDLKNRKSL